jgi:hypothetical protein
VEGWLDEAHRVLEEHPEIVLVTGRRRERFPQQSKYNRLADLDWDQPVGQTKGSHGDIMIRAEAFRQVGGFNPTIPVGEDYELCVRLRQNGGILLRIAAEATVHDIAMTRFKQWWRRCERTGYGYAEGAVLHGRPPEKHWVREACSVTLWGIVLPLTILVSVWPTRGMSLVLLGGYVVLYWRVLRYASRRGWSTPDARLYAFWCVLGRFPMAVGLLVYWIRRLTRQPRQLIEYKGVSLQ